MNRIKRKQIQQLEQRRKEDKKANIIIICIGIALFLFIVLFYCWNYRGEFKFERTTRQYAGKVVPDSIICMVNNSIIPEPPVAIVIGTKTYKGCCNSCINRLQYNLNNSRYATDPYSGHSIDKATAVITEMPDGSGRLLYFESENDFISYRDLNAALYKKKQLIFN